MQEQYLKSHLLIAMPSLSDGVFTKGVTYLCQHNEDGALGLMINRPSGYQLKELFKQMDIKVTDLKAEDIPVYIGGPVQNERGFVLHEAGKTWDSTYEVNDEFSVTASRDILEDIARGEGPEHFLIALGYAGWAPGQLEQEFRENSWLSTAADSQILFETPDTERWKEAADRLGFDIRMLSGSGGTA